MRKVIPRTTDPKGKEVRRVKRFLTVAIVSAAFTTTFFSGSFGSASVNNEANSTTNNRIEPVVRVERTVTETSVSVAVGSHTVVSGETLTGISEELLGNEEYFTVIFDQNMETLEESAQAHGFESSEGGHWIFPGQELKVSIPVISVTTRTVVQEQVVENNSEETPTVETTSSPTPQPSVAATSTVEVVATATVDPVETSTSTTVASATSTEVAESPTATSTNTATQTSSPRATFTAEPTETTSATATVTATFTVTPTATATPVPFVFSPSLPLSAQEGITFYISTSFGEMSYGEAHRGVDIATRQQVGGFPIKAIEQGTVTQSGLNGTYGYSVTIQHPDGKESLYGHLSGKPSVSVGQFISKEEVVGFMGTTGFSTGNHLHLELSVDDTLVDPEIYLNLSSEQLNFISPPETPEPVVEVITQKDFLREFFPQIADARDRAIWSTAVARNRKLDFDRLVWLVAADKARKQQVEDLFIARFLLYPWVSKPSRDYEKELVYISQLKVYTVRVGDSLSSISVRAGVKPETIAWVNGFATDQVLSSGQEVALPPEATEIEPQVEVPAFVGTASDPLGLGYPVGPEHYVPFLREMASLYGSSFDQLFTTINECENGRWNANDYHWDSGSYTGGIGQFKEGTYKSNARYMGLSQVEIDDWLNPYNQLRVMAWMFADGSARQWSCWRLIYGS